MKDEDSNKLEQLRWILDKQLGWISSAETKATTFIAFNSAIFAVLGSVFELKTLTKMDIITPQLGISFAGLTVIVALIGLFFLLQVFSPRVKGFSTASKSSIFFNKIIKDYNEIEYTDKMINNIYLDSAFDISYQIYANARIASKKHHLVIIGIRWTYVTIILTLLSILFKVIT